MEKFVKSHVILTKVVFPVLKAFANNTNNKVMRYLLKDIEALYRATPEEVEAELKERGLWDLNDKE